MLKPTDIEDLQGKHSRYAVVIGVAKRAREIVDGSEPLNSGDAKKPVTMALQEIGEDKISYEQTTEGIK
jgi:DNA-directed RNA polymerase subunit omega